MHVDDPVHEVEANEAHWKYDPGVLVYITRTYAVHFAEVPDDLALEIRTAAHSVLQRVPFPVLVSHFLKFQTFF